MDKAYLGSISVKVQVPDIEFKNREMLREFRRAMRQAHKEGIDNGRQVLKRVLYERKVFDTGKLMQSVARKLFVKSEDVFSGDVHFNEPGKEYAYFAEHGRGPSTELDEKGRPVLPPKEVITSWANRHGITSSRHIFNIRKKIAEEGSKYYREHRGESNFMEQAEKEIQQSYEDIVNRAVEKYKRDIK